MSAILTLRHTPCIILLPLENGLDLHWAKDCTGQPERTPALGQILREAIMNHPVYAVVFMAMLALQPVVVSANAPKDAAPSAFPLRPQYIDVTVLETADLAARFEEVIVVDVRSQYEYDTLRIQNALLLPVTDKNFVQEVRRLRESSTKPIVFYCNGKTCRKSYDAALMAQSSRIPNVYCYDAGVFDWAKAHPEKTALLGKTPMNPKALIDSDRFKERLLPPKDFAAKAEGAAVILDVRDRAQRDTPLFPFRELRAQLDENAKIDAAIEQAKREKKTLLIYDAVGKQVQWMQYHIEEKGLADYYFMKGGAQAYWDATLGKVSLGTAKAK